MTDRDHDSAFVVVDRAPVRWPAGLAFFVGKPSVSPLPAGYLEPVVQIVNGVEDRVAVLDIHDGAVGEHLAHAGGKDLPLVQSPILFRAVEIVDHQETSAQQILAQLRSE